jgi:hypothetical protein
MEADNRPYDAVRAQLMKYAVPYSDARSEEGGELRTTYSYFCRVCSEQLAEFVEEDRTAEVLGAVGNLDDHIKKLIWVEAASATEFVRFPVPVDPRHFGTAAVEVCHPALLLAEESLLKRRRRAAARPREDDLYGDAETVDPRTHLYVVLFVYGYVLSLIGSSRTEKSGGDRLGFEGVHPDAKMSVYAATILTTVLKKYAGLIAQIEDVTPEFVADRFREAYRLVAGRGESQVISAADEAKIIVNEIVALSPPYRYSAIAARVFGVLPVERPLTPAAARLEFETALGRTLPAILDDRAVETKSELVQMLLGIRPASGRARRSAVEYPSEADPLNIYNAPEVNFLYKMFRAPAGYEVDLGPLRAQAALAASTPACSTRCVHEAIGGREGPAAPGSSRIGLHMDPVLGPIELGLYLEAYRLFTAYTTEVVDAETMAAYETRLAETRLCERGFLLRRAAMAAKNSRRFSFTVSRRFGLFRGPPGAAPLTYLYDEDGLRHSWATPGGESIYVYSGGGAEYTRAELARALASGYASGGRTGPTHGRQLLDIRCSVCNTLLSEVHTLDTLKTAESLQALGEFDAFFSFYTSRCPLQALHDFDASRICSKCGMTEVLIFGHRAPRHAALARAFFDRYIKLYRSQRDTVGAVADLHSPAAGRHLDLAAQALAKFQSFAEQWQPDYTLLVWAANLIEAPVAVFETLGATEGRVYSEVLSGAHAPPPPTSLDDPRLLAVDSDVRVFTSDYNRLRFVGRFPKTPPEVEALLVAAKVPNHEYGTLTAWLPDVYDDYHMKRLALLQVRPPEDVLLFSIESLARMALAVATVDTRPGQPNWIAGLGKEFARQELRAIVRSERLLAKNGPFNFNIFGEEDIRGASLGGDTPYISDYGASGGEEPETYDGYEAATPFSLEAVDIDADDPNLEPQ